MLNGLTPKYRSFSFKVGWPSLVNANLQTLQHRPLSVCTVHCRRHPDVYLKGTVASSSPVIVNLVYTMRQLFRNFPGITFVKW